MTLRKWLKENRAGDMLGRNARAWLKQDGPNAMHRRPYREHMLHLAFCMRGSDGRHMCFRFALREPMTKAELSTYE